ncbi:uracil-DNA glycosylase [Candidatus Izimaplasma bacterium ZiA1]|uniref:uracil-DNA glycosylase n=1 Tax=Candidatus Izimoplasma sp. ZiA1 TaxID=2024899 RepID=UPI000BAA66E3|nr:uracil-DNA glycosylase [Candidatus Izimaplasma bacterium ZiA1]
MFNKEWNIILEEEINKEYFIDLMDQVNKSYENNTVYPKKDNIFNAFKFTDFNEIKAVIIGQDPYHNPSQANGLAFSVSKSVKIPPSLLNIFKELRDDLGYAIPSHGDLTYWAKQGVFLINSILTVEENKPSSHKNIGWEKFILETISKISKLKTNVVFILWGNYAKKYQEVIDEKKHLIISSSHPSPLSARHSFFGSKVFSKTNEYLSKNNKNVIDFKIEKNLLDF